LGDFTAPDDPAAREGEGNRRKKGRKVKGGFCGRQFNLSEVAEEGKWDKNHRITEEKHRFLGAVL